MNWSEHKQGWGGCTRCELAKTRQRVCLARGTIPCDVLMIGEAPGASEDVLGQPFVGPAGKLLDRMVSAAMGEPPVTIAYSNLLACIPKDESGNKIASGDDIPKESIEACAPRVKQLVQMCQPSGIVLIGKLAAKHIKGQADFSDLPNYECSWLRNKPDSYIHFCEIDHPAFILRLDVTQQGLAIKRNTIALRDLFESVSVPF